MYSNEDKIQAQFDSFQLGFTGSLDVENRWIKKAKLIPWDELEPLYSHHFSNHGRPAKRFRVALGSLIIQETLGLTDRDLVDAISENVYLQFFIGLPGFRKERPFDPTLLVLFRKRLQWESVATVNDTIAKLNDKKKAAEKKDDENTPEPPSTGFQDTIIIDATCTPADIRHPQDLTLLDECRRSTEHLIDLLYKHKGLAVPRTYRIQARRQFLTSVKKRNKSTQDLRKALGKQLRYLKRNLGHLNNLISNYYADGFCKNGCLATLNKRDYKNLLVINEIYRQQRDMWLRKSTSVSDRIVSKAQPHIRPIIRGKARSNTEFGAKISVASSKGFVFVDKISFDAYSESKDVVLHAEAYKARTGRYPDQILCDKAYQNRANREWCNERGIKLMGKKQGRQFEDPFIQKCLKKIERIDEASRVAIEGKIGVQKRRYSWSLITGKSPESAKTMIMLSTLAANLEHLIRILGNFIFVLYQTLKITFPWIRSNSWKVSFLPRINV